MGNAKTKDADYLKTEKLLLSSYANTGLEFGSKEVTSYKLKIQDAQNYFLASFDYFLIFNNFVFQQRMNALYDNYNAKVEQFMNNNKTFLVLINFDEEPEYDEEGNKIEFDSLFTIVFEKLEINVIVYADMTNVSQEYINIFFNQMIESVDLYKYNRKFDCFYALLPNTDYFIKNDFSIVYISNNKYDYKDIQDDNYRAIFENDDVKKLLHCRYPRTEANHNLEYLIPEIKPSFIKLFMLLSFANKFETFIVENEAQFALIQACIENCKVIDITIDLLSNFNENIGNLNSFYQNLKKNLSLLIKKCILILNNRKEELNTLILRFTSRKYFDKFHYEEIFDILEESIEKNNLNTKFICEFLFIKNFDLQSARSSNNPTNNIVAYEKFDINYSFEEDYSFYLKYMHLKKGIQIQPVKLIENMLLLPTYIRTSEVLTLNNDDLKKFLL